MPNGITPEELDRWRRDYEARTDRIHGEQDSRIARVAADSVRVDVWQQAERAHVTEAQRLEREHARDIAAVREEIKELRGRGWLTTGRFVMIFLAFIALATLLLTAWTSLKGAK